VPRCTAAEPFVCARPARTVACSAPELISMSVADADGPVPGPGVYIFEGRWRPASLAAADTFAVEKIAPMPWPPTPE
jgi:hypothetical protein